jgi:hypothetical protein
MRNCVVKKIKKIKKKEWKNNYDGEEELGVVVDSNKFPSTQFYNSPAERMLVDIKERIKYVYEKEIIVEVETGWIPILTRIKKMLEIIINEECFLNKIEILKNLHDEIILLLPSPPPPNIPAHPVGMEVLTKPPEIIRLINVHSQTVEKNRQIEIKQLENIKMLIEKDKVPQKV